MPKTLYDVLGVSPNAPIDDIKKVYKKLAIEHHPDKGGNEARFKEISEAYNTLSDKNKRNEYDAQLQGPSMFHNDLFSSGFMNTFFQQTKTPPLRKQILKNVQLSLKEAYLGCKKIIDVECAKLCECAVECTQCEGMGTITRMKTTTMGHTRFMQPVREKCNICQGTTFNVKKSDCTICKGTRKIIKTARITMDIPERTSDDIKSVMRHPSQPNLDIVLHVQVNLPKGFMKYNNHLMFIKEISLVDAILGNVFSIPHPSGENIEVDYTNNNNVIRQDTVVTIKNKGLRVNTDLLVKFDVQFPRKRASQSSMKDTFDTTRENLHKIFSL